MTFSKTELVAYVTEKTGFKKAESHAAVEAFFSGITEALAKGDDARFIGFGTFTVQQTKDREGINPRTKEKIQIKASKRATFKAGTELKAAVNVVG
jgi:DNA-binding protein HU-beta